jgi:hypothetical protein
MAHKQRPGTPKTSSKQVDNSISEGMCQVCGKPYPVWFAPNPLWNKVMRHPDGREASEKYAFICMDCFALESEKVGVIPTAWMLTTEKEAEASNQESPGSNLVSTNILPQADTTVNDLELDTPIGSPDTANPPKSAPTKALREDVKKYLEANLLDGDKIQPGQMIASTEILEVVTDLITSKVLEARKDTASTALRACPTKDHMLRLWLEQHIDSLNRQLKEQEG